MAYENFESKLIFIDFMLSRFSLRTSVFKNFIKILIILKDQSANYEFTKIKYALNSSKL